MASNIFALRTKTLRKQSTYLSSGRKYFSLFSEKSKKAKIFSLQCLRKTKLRLFGI